jgi:hypothetical protein
MAHPPPLIHFDEIRVSSSKERKKLKSYLRLVLCSLPFPNVTIKNISGKLLHEGSFNIPFQKSLHQGTFYLSADVLQETHREGLQFSRNSSFIVGDVCCRSFTEIVIEFVKSIRQDAPDDIISITLIESTDNISTYEPRFEDACEFTEELIGMLKPYYDALHPEYIDLIKVYFASDMETHEDFYWYPRKYIPEKYICKSLSSVSDEVCILR